MKKLNSNNCTRFNGFVSCKDRERLHGHKGAVVWFTGFSASGKSTIAHFLEKHLHKRGCSTYVFDGDNVRHGLSSDLGFSENDRKENIRRIGEMTRLFVDAGIIAITAFISPFRKDRQKIRGLFSKDQFIEVFVDCPIETCEKRDQKGIYQKAKMGIIKNFTGISSPYEAPEHPDIVLRSLEILPMDSALTIVSLLEQRNIVYRKSEDEKFVRPNLTGKESPR